MSAQLATTVAAAHEQLVTMRINNQLLGIPVYDVREILREQKITSIPLVPGEIAGALNLRGRIVTVVDIRHRLGLPTRNAAKAAIFVVVEHKGELYSLVVDSVGDVLAIPASSIQATPPNLDSSWREIASGVHRLEKDLLVILDPKRLFAFE